MNVGKKIGERRIGDQDKRKSRTKSRRKELTDKRKSSGKKMTN